MFIICLVGLLRLILRCFGFGAALCFIYQEGFNNEGRVAYLVFDTLPFSNNISFHLLP